MVSYISELRHVCLSREVGGGGDSAYERGEDARRLAWECKFLDFGLT